MEAGESELDSHATDDMSNYILYTLLDLLVRIATTTKVPFPLPPPQPLPLLYSTLLYYSIFVVARGCGCGY